MIDPEVALLMANSQDALAREYRSPLGGVAAGRLELVKGAVQLTVSGNAPSDLLFDARFSSAMAHITVEGSTVRVSYERHGGSRSRSAPSGTMALNPRIPWTIACHFGAVRLDLDLTAVRLESLSFDGGVSQVNVHLPVPAGEVPVTIAGGMHQLTIRRPSSAPVRLRLRGGAAHLAFDDQRLDAVAGQTELTSAGFDETEPRYEVVVTGGASELRIESVTPAPDTTARG